MVTQKQKSDKLSEEAKMLIASNLTMAEYISRPPREVPTNKTKLRTDEILDTFKKYYRLLAGSNV